jgi:hypothetical protein
MLFRPVVCCKPFVELYYGYAKYCHPLNVNDTSDDGRGFGLRSGNTSDTIPPEGGSSVSPHAISPKRRDSEQHRLDGPANFRAYRDRAPAMDCRRCTKVRCRQTNTLNESSLFLHVCLVLLILVADEFEHIAVRDQRQSSLNRDRPRVVFRIFESHFQIHVTEIAAAIALTDAH